MSLTFGSSPLLLAVCVLLAAAAAWWSYRTTVPDVGMLRKVLLATTRFAALALVLFLLFEPLFARERTVREEPIVGLLVDASESMTFPDSTGSETAASVVQRLRASLGAERVRAYSFGGTISSMDSVQTLSFDGTTTDVSEALTALSDELRMEPLGAVVLLSDGIHNTGANPLHVSERYRVPIVAVAHGDSTVRRDVRIVQLVTNELAYAGAEVPVRVRVRNDGFGATPVSVSLSRDGVVLDSQSLVLPADAGEVVTDLIFRADTPGLLRLQVSVSRIDGEATFLNNTESVSVRVLDQRRQILLVGGAPSPDIAAWVQTLSADEDIELITRIQKAPGQFFEGALPDTLDGFNLIILAGFPGTATDPADSRLLANAVSGGVPVLFMLDHATDLRMLQRDWQGILPVVPETIRSTWVPASFAATPLAAGHAVFDTGSRRDDGMWRRLPPLRTNESSWTVAPGADVLSTTTIRGVVLPDPLFVAGRSGRVRTAAILAHGMWRWTNIPEDLAGERDTWVAIRDNLLQWLYATDDERLVRIQPAATSFSEGEPVIMRGEVYDEALRPVSDASVTITLRAPDGSDVPVGMQAAGGGRYTVDAGTLPAGVYSYTGSAEWNGADLGSDSGEFVVGRQSLEYRNTRADFGLLDQIAARSGGQRIMASDADRLPAILASLSSYEPVVRAETSQTRLWQRYPFLVIILTLLTVEWFFRKRFGMV